MMWKIFGILLLAFIIVCGAIFYLTYLPQIRQSESYQEEIQKKQAEIKRLRARYDSISLVMYNDSLEFEALVKAKNSEINRLKKNAAKIDFSRANPVQLDSVVKRLYPDR